MKINLKMFGRNICGWNGTRILNRKLDVVKNALQQFVPSYKKKKQIY